MAILLSAFDVDVDVVEVDSSVVSATTVCAGFLQRADNTTTLLHRNYERACYLLTRQDGNDSKRSKHINAVGRTPSLPASLLGSMYMDKYSRFELAWRGRREVLAILLHLNPDEFPGNEQRAAELLGHHIWGGSRAMNVLRVLQMDLSLYFS